MKNRKSILIFFLLITGVVILVNILSNRFFVRLDFTADKRYTLSRATKDILRSLDKPVTVTAYMSEELPPQFSQLRRDFKEELVEYANRSGGKIVFEFINPNEDEKTEQQAMQAGINPVLINVRDKDQVKQQKAYMGAVLQYGEKKEVIPFIQPGAAMEYSLSTSIKKMSLTEKPYIGFARGNGEPSLSAMFQATQSLSVLYNVESVDLADSAANLSKYKVVVIIGPRDSIRQQAFFNLDNYLASGGNLYIALNRVDGNFQTAMGSELTTGLETWLAQKGLRVNPDFVIDQQCGSVMVSQQQGFMNFQTRMNFPYLPMITHFVDHPATKGLTTLVFPFASSMDFTGSGTDVLFTPLAMTSDKSGTERPPLYFNVNRPWQPGDFPLSRLTVAALLTGKMAGGASSKMIVVSDGDFPVNGEGNERREVSPDNLNLLVNGIEWLTDDTGLIDLRTKEVTSRPLDQLEDGTRAFLKYFNFLLPVILIIVYGAIRWQYRHTLRIKRMNENYF
jgi:gliding-associated putative ABC transporter substrate-binding component GldG